LLHVTKVVVVVVVVMVVVVIFGTWNPE